MLTESECDGMLGEQVKNEVVIWDRILRSKQDAHVALNSARNKYGFREVGRSFR